MKRPGLILAAIAVSAAALVALSQTEAGSAQTVIPRSGGAGGYVEDMTPVDVSLWEYSDKRTYVTTGKSITFRVPKAYFVMSEDREGGPQFSIDLTFDRVNRRPWLVGGTGETAPKGREGNAVRQSSKVGLALKTYGFVNAVFPRDRIESGGGIGAGPGWSATRVEGEHCGFDLFQRKEPWGVGNLGNGKVFDPRVDQAPPFNRAMRLARPHGVDTYDRIVTCTPVAGLEYPWCTMGADFEGWPMTLWFSGEHVCQIDALLLQVHRLLEGFVTNRTERRSGEQENRNTYGNRGRTGDAGD